METNKKAAFVELIIAGILLCGAISGTIGCQRAQETNDGRKGIEKVSADKNDQSANKKNLVEIFYLPHPPAQAIVKKVEAILQKYPAYTVKEYDFSDAANKQKIAEYKIVSHTPVIIFINGKNTFTIGNRALSLTSFPKGDAFVPSFEGNWSYNDLEQLLK